MAEQTEVKSDLQQRLESEGWKLLTNVPLHDTVDLRYTPQEVVENIKRGYGYANVRVENDAFDIYGNPITNMRAVYVKQSVFDKLRGKADNTCER